MFCRKCGKQIPDDSEFCCKCGARVVSIDDNSEQVSPSAPMESVVERTVEKSKISLDKPDASEQQQTIILDKPFSTIIKDGKKICPECGNKVTAPWCTYCGAEQTGESSKINLDKPDSSENQGGNLDIEVTSCRCYFCGEEMFSNQEKCSRCYAPNPEFDSTLPPSVKSRSIVAESEQNRRCPSCGKTIINDLKYCPYCSAEISATPIPTTVTPKLSKNCPLCGKPAIRNRESCPYCGEKYTATHQLHLTPKSPSYSVSYEDSEEYYNLKFGVTIAAWGILGVVILICMVTGELGFLGCSSPGEYEVEYTGNGAAAVVLTGIGVSVVRAIILGIAKHKNK